MTIQPLVPYTQIAAMKEYAPKSSGAFATIKNFFTGRFFQEWKMHVLTAGTIYYVAKAALSFFTGYWMLSLIEFLTGGILSIVRKDIRDFTNHYRVLAGHEKQNSRHELLNLQLRGENETFRESNRDLKFNIKDLEEQIQAFTGQMGVLRSENKSYSYNNEVHASLLKDLGATSVQLGREVRSAINSGQAINQELLAKFLTAMDTANAHRDALLHMKETLSIEQRESLARWQALADDVKEMGVDGVRALREAREKLDEALREIAALRGVRQELEQQVGLLRQAARVNLDTANYANGSVKKALAGPIKSFFSHPEQIFGLMCIAAIARHAFQLAT